MFSTLTMKEIASIVYNFIILKLGNKGVHSGHHYLKLGILDDIAYFKCRECKENFNITNICMSYNYCEKCSF